jgi:hypothetical protein
MKKQIDHDTGFTIKTTNDKLIIEAPIYNLIRGFETSPNNFLDDKIQVKIRRGMKLEFLEWIADNLQDECDNGDGDNFMAKMFDDLFMRIYEGYEEFALYPDDEEE